NITQQVSASIGTALFSVLLTNAYNAHANVIEPTLAIQSAAGDQGKLQAILAALHIPGDAVAGIVAQGLHYMGEAFGNVFGVATVLVALCLIPAFFLPRKPIEHGAAEQPTMMVG